MATETNVVFVGWNRVVPGHEQKALEIFMTFQNLYAAKQAAGVLESFETVLLSRHGGDLNGYTILRGSHDKLHAFTHSDEFEDNLLRAEMHVTGIGVIEGWTGAAVGDLMGRWSKIIAS